MRVIGMICIAGALMAAPAEKVKKPVKASAALTGCLDQRGEQFVLTSDKDLKTVTVLRVEGSSDDHFARFVGHKVTVEGTSTGDGEARTFLVSKLTDVADSCSFE